MAQKETPKGLNDLDMGPVGDETLTGPGSFSGTVEFSGINPKALGRLVGALPESQLVVLQTQRVYEDYGDRLEVEERAVELVQDQWLGYEQVDVEITWLASRIPPNAMESVDVWRVKITGHRNEEIEKE